MKRYDIKTLPLGVSSRRPSERRSYRSTTVHAKLRMYVSRRSLARRRWWLSPTFRFLHRKTSS